MLMRLICLGALAAAAVAIAACGGDDGPSQEEFVAEVTRACDAASADLAGVQTEIEEAVVGAVDEFDDPDARVEELVRERIVPVYESLASDLEAVTPPEDSQESYDELVSNAREQVELVANDPGVLFDEESPEAQRAEELTQENETIADELGLPEDCGDPPGGTTGATGPTGAEGSD